MAEQSEIPENETTEDPLQGETPLERVLAYHDHTKHGPGGFARSAGYMDWDNQPDPFRTYEGAALTPLMQVEPSLQPELDQIYELTSPARREPDILSLSQLLYDSLAISAWKEFRSNRWSLRCNPSSGNLHPTEAYLICGPLPGTEAGGGVFHYNALIHALERRSPLRSATWTRLHGGLPESSVLVGLSSIHWRESWKYGERAYRYCQHDVGHAIACLSYASAALGWHCRVLEGPTDSEIATLLRIDDQRGMEAEHPDCLLAIWPAHQASKAPLQTWRPAQAVLDEIGRAPRQGKASVLSPQYHPWPVIDAVSAACRREAPGKANATQLFQQAQETPATRSVSARQLFRSRRSAVEMDDEGTLAAEDFYRILARCLPHAEQPPLNALAWQPAVNLLLFVHRVEGLEPGLFLLLRCPQGQKQLRQSMRSEFPWDHPPGCPEQLPLFRLAEGDLRRVAKVVSCDQDIAADGAFAVAMLAAFEPLLREHGPDFYRRLHWETGVIGQVLYLEAEATKLAGTGIGCFFDDLLHECVGISDHAYQTLYHFTVGKPLVDQRLQTLPAYWHLEFVNN